MASRYLTHMKRLRARHRRRGRPLREPLEPLRRPTGSAWCSGSCPRTSSVTIDLLVAALGELPPADYCLSSATRAGCGAGARAARRARRSRRSATMRAAAPEAKPVGKPAYLRLHYGHRGRGGNCSEVELDGWRRRIAARRSRREVFVYLKQRLEGYAPANARYLRDGLRRGETEASPGYPLRRWTSCVRRSKAATASSCAWC